MDTKTLEERIRHAAREKLRAELNAAFEPGRNKCSLGYTIHVGGIKDHAGRDVRIHDALEKIIDAIFEQRREKSEEDAIEMFISKIDGIESQLNELRKSVEE